MPELCRPAAVEDSRRQGPVGGRKWSGGHRRPDGAGACAEGCRRKAVARMTTVQLRSAIIDVETGRRRVESRARQGEKETSRHGSGPATGDPRLRRGPRADREAAGAPSRRRAPDLGGVLRADGGRVPRAHPPGPAPHARRPSPAGGAAAAGGTARALGAGLAVVADAAAGDRGADRAGGLAVGVRGRPAAPRVLPTLPTAVLGVRPQQVRPPAPPLVTPRRRSRMQASRPDRAAWKGSRSAAKSGRGVSGKPLAGGPGLRLRAWLR